MRSRPLHAQTLKRILERDRKFHKLVNILVRVQTSADACIVCIEFLAL